ncbi:MAG: putative adenine modification enzyme [Prokaryotic dsDNA virus sp.]|nr:MAG: putative adenine modification enzyme [Prokaryotic dsDNA virus sp.]|tara:strand:- start:2423 stop:2917 length:495 start_codon:yes stop_codon:yes gene_type:complete
MSAFLRPITYRAACDFIERLHRHHKPPQGHKFSVGLDGGAGLIGVAVIGRPVARGADDGFTAEVTRLCTDGSPNACSALYGAAARAAKAMGYRRIITYTLESETGASLRASGWRRDGSVNGRSWSCPSRPREDKHPTVPKTRWVRDLAAPSSLTTDTEQKGVFA